MPRPEVHRPAAHRMHAVKALGVPTSISNTEDPSLAAPRLIAELQLSISADDLSSKGLLLLPDHSPNGSAIVENLFKGVQCP